MPARVLSDRPPPDAPLTGFFGKLPAAGDFVTRGLPVGFQAFWDGWAARHLAPRQGDWPPGGLRLRLQSGGRVAAGVVVPGADRVGRRFPLAAFVIGPALPAPPGLADWCDAAHVALIAAQTGGQAPDALCDALEALAPPEGHDEAPPMLLWHGAAEATPCDPAAPDPVLDRLFSCSGSSTP